MLVFGAYFELNYLLIIGLISSLIFGAMSYYIIERKISHIDWSKLSSLAYISISISLLAPYLGFIDSRIGYVYHSISNDFAIQQEIYHKKYNLNHQDFSLPPISNDYTCSLDSGAKSLEAWGCLTYFHTQGTKKVLIIGDSHGRDFFHAFRLAFLEYNVSILEQSNCSPAEDNKFENGNGGKCFEQLDDLLARSDIFDLVIYASRYVAQNTYPAFFERMKKDATDNNIVIVNTTGFIIRSVMTYVDKYGVREYYNITNNRLDPIVDVNNELDTLKSSSIHIFDKQGVFFNGSERMLIKDGHVLVFDNQHLSEPGIIYLSEIIKRSQLFKSLLSS